MHAFKSLVPCTYSAQQLDMQVITNLDLSYNNFAARGCVAIAEALEANGRIKELSLRGNNMGDTGAQRLAKTVTKSGKLTKLDVSDNGIGEVGGAALGHLIATSRPLKQADFSWNSVRSLGAIAIAEGLKLSSLVRLNLAWNGKWATGSMCEHSMRPKQCVGVKEATHLRSWHRPWRARRRGDRKCSQG